MLEAFTTHIALLLLLKFHFHLDCMRDNLQRTSLLYAHFVCTRRESFSEQRTCTPPPHRVARGPVWDDCACTRWSPVTKVGHLHMHVRVTITGTIAQRCVGGRRRTELVKAFSLLDWQTREHDFFVHTITMSCSNVKRTCKTACWLY